MLRVGVIGCGYWGPNVVRNFMEIEESVVVAVSDLSYDRLEFISGRYPTIQTTVDYKLLLANPHIDAVAITTPVFTHYKIVKEALSAGKHVMVEKPLALTARECEELIALAKKKKRVILVDHTFLYTGAVEKIKALYDKGEIGKLLYFDAARVNVGLFRYDVNVIWDLAPHDVSILLTLVEKDPVSVVTFGVSHLKGQQVDLAYIHIDFGNNLIAHVGVNWIAPAKVRMIFIGGDKKMIVYNDLEGDEKVKVYDRSHQTALDKRDYQKMYIESRSGDMVVPKLDTTEGLRKVCLDFIHSIERKKKPRCDGEMGLRVVRLLEAANKSLLSGGKKIYLRKG